jgi:hypothetical protein
MTVLEEDEEIIEEIIEETEFSRNSTRMSFPCSSISNSLSGIVSV